MKSDKVSAQLKDIIQKLEDSLKDRRDIDSAYESFVETVQGEMRDRLPTRRKFLSQSNYKRKQRKQAWWNDDLSQSWNDMCAAERVWLKASRGRRKIENQNYISLRKNFDRHIQRAKRRYRSAVLTNLESLCDQDPGQFWKSVGRIGVGSERRKGIPLEIVREDGSVCRDKVEVLDRWKHDYEGLLNSTEVQEQDASKTDIPSTDEVIPDPSLVCEISMEEVERAMRKAKSGKSPGIDNIPAQLLKNNSRFTVTLHKLCNICFNNSYIPKMWSQTIIHPIPKSSSADPRDPLSYRGIALAPVSYKLYCSVLNDRLTTWAEYNEILNDKQNGFRRGRSTVDHIGSLTSIIETRKLMRKPTYVCFIDFKKAYDRIDRSTLWKRLADNGVNGKMLLALKSLYTDVRCCVRINRLCTSWFSVNQGVKQGCLLSPILFNLFLNDLIEEINAVGRGVDVNGETVNVLAYADDIVLIAGTEEDLNFLLDVLGHWCVENKMEINAAKSKVIQFRTPSTPRTSFTFKCGNAELEVVDSYNYLGVLLTEHLNYDLMAKAASKSANRALGLLIAKFKSLGGMPFNVYSKLYDTMVWPVLGYGAAIWGTKQYSCVNAVHHRAIRFFLGVGKYVPNLAVNGEVGWIPPVVRQWTCVSRHWARLTNTGTSRLNKRVFVWADNSASHSRKRNWNFRFRELMSKHNLGDLLNIKQNLENKLFVRTVENVLLEDYKLNWKNDMALDTSTKGTGRSKLRTYKLFKTEYAKENYVTRPMSRQHRSSLAKFRCGVAPLRIETGRFENVPLQARTCFNCTDTIEDEQHVLTTCPLYSNIREKLFNICSTKTTDFTNMPNVKKMCLFFTCPDLTFHVAKTCDDILAKRRSILYK